MARFMDFHEDLKLPAEAIAQLAEDTRNASADQFGVRQIELYHWANRAGQPRTATVTLTTGPAG